MREKETLSHYRVISFLIILLCMVALSSFYCFMKGVDLDLLLLGYVIDILFFLALLFQLEFERKRKKLSDNIETSFMRIATGFGICTIISGASFFAPEFFRPVILFPLIMYAVSNTVISLEASMYFSLLICLFLSDSLFEFGAYVLLIVVSIVWIRALEEKEYQFYASVLLSLLAFFVPQLFSYFELRHLEIINLIYGAIISVVLFFISYFAYHKVRINTKDEIQNRMIDILADSYTEVVELKSYSSSEFKHAKFVSDVCYKLAENLGFDAKLAASAGFYYRLGKWKGEPHVENGVIYAKKLCFPEHVTKILEEYYGEERLPSSKESALVHLVDGTIKKLEVLKDEAGSSTWNTEILIYQTTNEFSQSGIYDESGLGMNQFLKIREYLAKEANLVEFLS